MIAGYMSVFMVNCNCDNNFGIIIVTIDFIAIQLWLVFQRKQARKKVVREYVPAYRSGPYALMLTLYRQSQVRSCTNLTNSYLRMSVLFVFVHPSCIHKFMSQSCGTVTFIEHAHGGRFEGNYSTFGQNDNFARFYSLKRLVTPTFFFWTHHLL